MAYRDDVTALAARHDALAAEVAQKTRELEASRRLLEQAWTRARLPVLDQIRVASPCSADWNQMTGDDRTRHCGECRKNVYNLSGMTREEAEALIRERNGDLCVRYYQRADGTILLADCTVGVERLRRRGKAAARAAALVASGLVVAGAAASRVTVKMGAVSHDEVHAVMGSPPAIALDPPSELSHVKIDPIRHHARGAQDPDVEQRFPPPSMKLPPDPPSAPQPPQLRLDPPRLVMGAVSPPSWQDPQPSQPAAPWTRHPTPAADKRAR